MDNSTIASSESGEETQQPAVGGSTGGGEEQTPQLFCLRWNNYQSNLTNVFDQLLQNESFVDVTLACADGHTVKAHKMVLSACSPYFQSLFFENPCKHPIVILKDIKWTELKAAVEFMYKGEINVCQEQIAPLLKVAESLKIRGLADVSNEHDFARDSKSPTVSGSSSAANTETISARSPSRVSLANSGGQPPTKKRRRTSADRSSNSTGEDTISVINSPSRALELVTSPSSSSVGTTSVCSTNMNSTGNTSSSHQQQQQQQQHNQSQSGRPSQSSTPQSPSNIQPLPLPPPPPTLPSTSSVADDMEIKPGIAEMIREEERAKMLESSQAWLNASTSLAYYASAASASASAATCGGGGASAQSSGTSSSSGSGSSSAAASSGSLKLKVPTWTQAQLKEAIQAVVTQQMRFTQASTYFGIPKGTLYDNILGKTKRMQALEEAALSQDEETAVLEFCCQISESPYNRRTRKSLNEVLTFVSNLRQRKDPAFEFKGLSGFRWWWAFCKKHSIVSLHYSGAGAASADSYQYQLQSMWQKCWNTNQSLVHNLRFRERGPLKSWRPETMAEAILSVLKEGLSLSQAARKYDIPYPTFVLYANRVHNMLGPSVDGGSDLRPKGRGRPQRILLGYWPEDHIQNVIRAVVFRDPQHIKDEPLNLGYPRLSCFQEPLSMYGNNNSCLNSPEPPVSPNSTAAVIAMAQGLRQQVLAAAAAHSNNNDNNFGFFASQCANGSPSLLMATPLQSPNSTPPASPVSNENLEVGIGVTGVPFKSTDNFPVKSEMLFQDEIEDLVMKSPHSRTPTSSADQPKPLPLVLEQRSD